MIGDMLSNKKHNPVVTVLFIRKENQIFFLFLSQIFIEKHIRLNSMHYFVMKIPNKREFHEIFNHSLIVHQILTFEIL